MAVGSVRCANFLVFDVDAEVTRAAGIPHHDHRSTVRECLPGAIGSTEVFVEL
jgi:hypothetical protein